MKKIALIIVLFIMSFNAQSQVSNYKFGQGLNIYGKDSSFYMKFGIRFQNLYSNEWNVRDDNFGTIEDYQANFMVRRSRLKFDGFAVTPKLKYKVELGLSNSDISGGDTPEHSNVARMILDAYVDWNFAGNFSLRVGQGKLPGNRERVISSANLQFVDRSRLNSRYNIDRDMGLMLTHHFNIGKNFLVIEKASISQGEGRDITVGYNDGFCYTFRVEFLPFGKFTSKGDYVGAAVKKEEKPKLALGITYDINDNAIRERGQLGSFIQDANGDYFGKTLYTTFADLMFKYKGFSLMAEYANKKTEDGDFRVYDDNLIQVGKFYTGQALNVQAGYMFNNNYELAVRMTSNRPDFGVAANENEYGIGFSKYFVGHQLKVQTDINYRQRYVYGSSALNQGSDDKLYWRVQMDIHF
ncbi:MAG: porin [Crocinitomicaceae bacterium]|nr:porin [Crocinitomicaceae bacterium]